MTLAMTMPSLLSTPLKPLLRLGGIFALALLLAPQAQAQAPAVPLADTTIYIIRHGEKPADGAALSPEGTKRAQGYVEFFTTLKVKKQPVKVEHLFAAADSKNSARPRLTLEPLSRALNLPLDLRFEADDVKGLAEDLRTKDHGRCIVICWHHGPIPELLKELGVDPADLLEDGEWPDKVFDWVIQLRYDAAGKIVPKRSVRFAIRWGK